MEKLVAKRGHDGQQPETMSIVAALIDITNSLRTGGSAAINRYGLTLTNRGYTYDYQVTKTEGDGPKQKLLLQALVWLTEPENNALGKTLIYGPGLPTEIRAIGWDNWRNALANSLASHSMAGQAHLLTILAGLHVTPERIDMLGAHRVIQGAISHIARRFGDNRPPFEQAV